MRSETILSIAAFVLAFGFSTAFAGLFITQPQAESVYVSVNGYRPTGCFKYKNKATTANKISALISQDKRNGYESNQTFNGSGANIFSPSDSAFSGYAKYVEQYADSSSSMKVSDLPDDFQAEWREHMKAWRDYSQFLNRMKNNSSRRSLTAEELEQIDNFHSREINRTYEKVLESGMSYGADVY